MGIKLKLAAKKVPNQTLLPHIKLKKSVLTIALLGLAAFLGYIFIFTDFSSVANVIAKTNVTVYALAFLCVFVGSIFNALTWESTLNALGVETKFRRIFSLNWAGYFVDAIVPGPWTGDIFKAYLMSKEPNAKGAKVAASIVVKNILDVIITLVALTTGMVLLALNYTLAGGVVLVGSVIMLVMDLPSILIIYFSSNINTAKRIWKWANRQASRVRGQPQVVDPSSENKIENSLKDFHEGLMLMKNKPRAMIKPLVFQALAWTLDILTLFLIFSSLGYVIGPDRLIITNTVVVNMQAQGIALIGFAQVAASTIYTALGVAQSVSIASGVLAGFATFWFKMAISFFAFQAVVFERYNPFISSRKKDLGAEKMQVPKHQQPL